MGFTGRSTSDLDRLACLAARQLGAARSFQARPFVMLKQPEMADQAVRLILEAKDQVTPVVDRSNVMLDSFEKKAESSTAG